MEAECGSEVINTIVSKLTAVHNDRIGFMQRPLRYEVGLARGSELIPRCCPRHASGTRECLQGPACSLDKRTTLRKFPVWAGNNWENNAPGISTAHGPPGARRT